MDRWFVLRINPEPWEIGPLSVARKGKMLYPKIGPNAQLVAFKKAVHEELGSDVAVLSGEVCIELYIQRRLDKYQTNTGRSTRKHEADATNMQKAIEDAIQNVLIENDQKVRHIQTTIMDQGPDIEPLIILRVYPFEGLNPDLVPDHVWSEVDRNELMPPGDTKDESYDQYIQDELF